MRKVRWALAVLAAVLVFPATAAAGETRLSWTLENGGNITVCGVQNLPYSTYFVQGVGSACSLGGDPYAVVSCELNQYAGFSLLPAWYRSDTGRRCETHSLVNIAGQVSSKYDFRVELSRSRFQCCKSGVNLPGYVVWEIGTERRVVKGTIWAR